MLMVWLGFLVYIVLRLLTGDDGSMYKFVSWNEFVHDMLAKGEVEEIIVRPETETAFIRLHPDAVVRGSKVIDFFNFCYNLHVISPKIMYTIKRQNNLLIF